jgi:hypothetical protein
VRQRLPKLRMVARAKRDITQCLSFIADQRWGDPHGRRLDIFYAMDLICVLPQGRRVEHTRKSSGARLRRCSAAQFVVIYAYFKPTKPWPTGLVSIRAIRHRRVRNVFSGVRDTSGELPPLYG